MTAALKSNIPDRRFSARTPTAYRERAAQPVDPRLDPRYGKPQYQTAAPPTISPFPRPRPFPAWLKVLVKVQKSSSILTFLLMGTVLMMYGWTVFTQQRWGHEYRRWEALQKHEQQLMATNEVLKNQMAQQAESPKAGLVAPDPTSMIFLAPAPQRPPVQSDVEVSTPDPIPNRPLGY